MKFYQRLHTKLIFGFLLVVLISSTTIGLYAMKTSSEALHQRELNTQTVLLKSFKQEIETFITSARKDIIFLSQSQPLKRYLTLRGFHQSSPAVELAQQALEQEFYALALGRSDIYYQIRYIDETGMEMVRIDAREEQIYFVPKTQLQNQAHQYYFIRTMKLSGREIFVSPLDLNQEHGKIEVPHKPVIRFAIPIFYPDGRQAGIIIINVDANQFLQRLGKAWLINEEGYYLAHSEENKRWGDANDLNTGHNLQQDYPAVAPAVLAKGEGNLGSDQFMWFFQRVNIPELGYWILISRVAIDDILRPITAFRITSIVIIIITLIIAAIITFAISQTVTEPIKSLIHLVRQIRSGNRQIRVQEVRQDEFGLLEKGLNSMLEAIKASEEALQQAKEEAEAANIAKSRFLANMSHELRTPLNAIIGYGEMLQEELAELGEIELSNDIEKIYLAGKYLLSTINDILDISKIEAGKMELYTETFLLPNMINDVVQTIQPLLAKNQDVLEVVYGDQLGEMHADLTKVRQILLNLLSNASKFNEQRGNITLTVQQEITNDDKQWIVFQVADKGIGMDEVQIQKLFQAFSQADNSPTRKYGGMGLGLALTHHLVQMMSGKISVTSELGKGSTFTVRLPAQVDLTQESSFPSAPSQIAVLEEGGIVLVIDDEEEVRTVLQKYLSKLGYQVEVTDSGEEGLRLARKILPDVIILDVMMPKMDGWEVLTHLKADAELAHIPVIILSMIDEKNVGYSLGASDYLIKPITREQLSKVLQKYHSHNDAVPLIMVIEDDPVTRDMVARILRKAGWRVCKVEDGRVALNYIQKRQPHLIVLDLQMPEMDGFEFATKLHQLYESISIIIVSAKDITAEDRVRLNKNVAAILQKGSYSREQLLGLIEKLLSTKANPS